MSGLSYTLLSDGSTDQALIPILTWSLRVQGVACAIQPSWADLRRLHRPPHRLADRVVQAVYLYPCDLLFVHRDAETAPPQSRIAEIGAALEDARLQGPIPPHVCVVPVRMQEAWLLFDEAAIRRAAGNPNGEEALELPALVRMEQLPSPKAVLHNLLGQASGLHGRRRKRLDLSTLAMRVAEFISDYSPLIALPAFRQLQAAIEDAVRREGWC